MEEIGIAVLLRYLGGVLLTVAASVAGRVLLSLGFSFVTFTGFNVGIDWLKSQIVSNIGAMPADVVNFLAFMWVDKAIGCVFSAYAAAVLISFAGGSTLTKMIAKKL